MKLNFWIATRMLFSRQILFGGSAPFSFLGLVLGVALLVVSMAVMSGYFETLKNAMTDVTADLQLVRRGKLAENWSDFAKKVKEHEPQIQSMMRFANTEAVMAKQGRVSGVLFQGVDSAEVNNVLQINKRIKKGQLNVSGDNVIIGNGLAKKHQIAVGDKIYLVIPLATPFDNSGFRRKSQEYSVSGIIDFGKNDWNERLVVGDLKSLQLLTEIGNRYTGAFVKIKDRDQAEKVATELSDWLGSAYSLTTWYDVNRSLFEAVIIERVVIFFVVFLIVIVAAFNISITLYVFIRQKYSDIAILKTLGVSQKKIRQIFLSQGIIVATLGTSAGIALGYLLCYGFMYLQDHYSLISGSVYKLDKIYTQVRWVDLFVICFATQVICLIASYFPSYKGSQLEVIEGLKNG